MRPIKMRLGIGFGLGPLRFYQPLTRGRRRRRSTPARPTTAEIIAERQERINTLQKAIQAHLAQAERYEPGSVRDRYLGKARIWTEELRVLRNEQNKDRAHGYYMAFAWVAMILVVVMVTH